MTELAQYVASGLVVGAIYGLIAIGFTAVYNVTGIVNRLATEGYIIRVPVRGDKRATVVRLTRKGHEHFSALASLHEGWVDDLLGALGPADTRTLADLLHRIGDDLEQRRKGKPIEDEE